MQLPGCNLPSSQYDDLLTSTMLTREPGELRDLAVKRETSSCLQGLVVLEVDLWGGGLELPGENGRRRTL